MVLDSLYPRISRQFTSLVTQNLVGNGTTCIAAITVVVCLAQHSLTKLNISIFWGGICKRPINHEILNITSGKRNVFIIFGRV